jgi:hypothetical protein
MSKAINALFQIRFLPTYSFILLSFCSSFLFDCHVQPPDIALISNNFFFIAFFILAAKLFAEKSASAPASARKK